MFHLVDDERAADKRLYKRLKTCTADCDDCACSANPVDITGERRETYASGARSSRLMDWALEQPNPADIDPATGAARPYSVVWREIQDDVHRSVHGAGLRLGLSRQRLKALKVATYALIEPPVKGRKKPGTNVMAPRKDWKVPPTRPQAAHADATEGLQGAYNLGLAPCASTHMYRDTYLPYEAGEKRANAFGRSAAEAARYAELRAELGGAGPSDGVAATLVQPRCELEQHLQPVAQLEPGEGVVFMGDAVHAGAGNKEGEWRLILFVTATWTRTQYDVNTQWLPWTVAHTVYNAAGLTQDLALEYSEEAPWRNFDKGFGDTLEKYIAKVKAAKQLRPLERWTEGRAG